VIGKNIAKQKAIHILQSPKYASICFSDFIKSIN
jgi:hypothetical protein